ncbi:DUF418 domain-containing protein [Massilia terrae]|uniref:DUF418 domain-containing protein n=1 Tax=Massilia terrae TaxID=1811224 RepID=A0ABT2D2Q8_9BURK|nr:DUF418 domain-containing protein [Massilia terrae]MCS0660519.1 DUF418 domain-containing protein [Massilia terrae]
MSLDSVVPDHRAAAAPLPATISPARDSERYDALDILRALALFGVLTVNLVTEFRVSLFAQFLPQPAEPSPIDRAVAWFVHYGLELKAFAVFSFLFGIGLAMQFERLAGTGRATVLLTRRLLVLLLFGLVHLLLVWNGDILTEYALAGLLVLPFLRASSRSLAILAAAMFGLYLILPVFPSVFPDAGWIARHVEQANRVYPNGSWLQVMRFSLEEIPSLLPLHLYIFPRTLGLFVLGILAWRSGIVANPAEHKTPIAATGWTLAAIGVTMTLAEALALLPATGPVRLLSNLAPVCLALAFAAAVLYLSEFTGARNWLRHFTALGRMAFTNYIAQSLIFSLVFFGFGLGLYGSLRPAPVFALGIGLYCVQVQMSKWWLRYYRFGPIEWCWRALMYGSAPPMKR